MPTTLKQLARAQQAYTKRREAAEAAATRRDVLIRQAVEEGVPQVAIARETGLVKQRIAQIVHGAGASD